MKAWLASFLAITVLAVAQPSMADDLPAINLKSAVLVPVEGPPVNVTGGVWLSDEQALRVADQLRLAGGLPSLAPPSTDGSWVAPVALGMALGLLGGVGLGYLLQ